MAMSQAAEMQPSLRRSLAFLLLCLAAVQASTLHLRRGPHHHTLPQNRGFFTVDASEDLAAADGGGGGGGGGGAAAGAPAPPLAAQDASQGGSDSGAAPPHRSRRSTGVSAMPKVYGQVRWRITSGLHLSGGKGVSGEMGEMGEIMQAPPSPPLRVVSQVAPSFLAPSAWGGGAK